MDFASCEQFSCQWSVELSESLKQFKKQLYPLINKIILFIASLLSLGGGMIAGRQIYLQHLPADQIPTCAPPMDFLIDTLPFMELIQTILLGDGNCAEYQWRFIFNFAEWALLFFVMLFVYNLYFIFTGFKR